jgi:hypothetical protein
MAGVAQPVGRLQFHRPQAEHGVKTTTWANPAMVSNPARAPGARWPTTRLDRRQHSTISTG